MTLSGAHPNRCFQAQCDAEMALDLFPELRNRIDIKAGLLSGGEQQMLALGRVLARRPKLLMVDELSLGLAPLVVRRLLAAVRAAVDEGVGVLLVEQHPRLALRYADHAYVMHRGRISHSATAEETLANIDEIERTFMSTSAAGADQH
ncbi:ATP-binding cassette domain-containing protein [Rhodococcus opacus]|nr:ATP-binding cassette domain-containing protein [Rhodococcus opacus]